QGAETCRSGRYGSSDVGNAQRPSLLLRRAAETAPQSDHPPSLYPRPPAADCPRRTASRAGLPLRRPARRSCVLVCPASLDSHGERSFGAANKFDDLADERLATTFSGNFFDTNAKFTLAEKQGLVSGAHAMNIRLGSAAPPQADNIEPKQISERPMRHAIRNDVGANPTEADDHGALPDANKLTNGDATGEHPMIPDVYVTCEKNIVREHHLIADLAIMRDMRANHEETAIANFGEATTVLSARAHCDIFADITIGTHHQLGRPAAVTQRLGRRTKRSKRMNDGPRPNCRVAREIDMGDQSAAVTDAHIRADGTIRAD